MEIRENNNIVFGMTFSNGIPDFKKNGRKNLFEDIITIQTIEEDENLSNDDKLKLLDILNSDITPFEKRIRVMRALDKEKEFSSKIAIILSRNLGKMKMIKEIMLIFRDYYIKSDILKKDFGEVLSPSSLVHDMILKIDDNFWVSAYDEDGNIKKVLETSNGSGIFLWFVIYKFMIGLKDFIKNENDRYKFIIENMIYACELQKSKMFNWLCIADIHDEYDLNVYCGSFLSTDKKGNYTSELDGDFDKHMKEVWGIDRISLVISNPPYQQMDGGAKASAKPIYNLFTLKSIKISEKVLFITPSRWFAGGKGLDSYRKFMMESNKIKVIKHFDNASKIFGNSVEIKGGVSYFLFDNNYNDKCFFNGVKFNLSDFDVIVSKTDSVSIVSKIINFKSISTICHPRSFFGIDISDKRIVNDKVDERYKVCYVSKHKGYSKWIDSNKVKKKSNSYRVVTPRAATRGGEGFGNLFITAPDEYITDSYISFWVNNENEAKSLLSYLKTKFSNYLLGLRKVSQTVKGDTCKWIPMVPFDREWTDEKLFEYFNITEEEIKLILEK